MRVAGGKPKEPLTRHLSPPTDTGIQQSRKRSGRRGHSRARTSDLGGGKDRTGSTGYASFDRSPILRQRWADSPAMRVTVSSMRCKGWTSLAQNCMLDAESMSRTTSCLSLSLLRVIFFIAELSGKKYRLLVPSHEWRKIIYYESLERFFCYRIVTCHVCRQVRTDGPPRTPGLPQPSAE